MSMGAGDIRYRFNDAQRKFDKQVKKKKKGTLQEKGARN